MGRTSGVKLPSCHIVTEPMSSTRFMTIGVDLHHLGMGSFFFFLVVLSLSARAFSRCSE